MIATQTWHNRTVTEFFKAAQGDLMLNGNGDLCWKYDTDGATFQPLPRGQLRAGPVLAHITREGWSLIWDGAEMLLCLIERSQLSDPKIRRHVALLRSIQADTAR